MIFKSKNVLCKSFHLTLEGIDPHFPGFLLVLICTEVPDLPELRDPHEVDDGAVPGRVGGQTFNDCLPKLHLLVGVPVGWKHRDRSIHTETQRAQPAGCMHAKSSLTSAYAKLGCSY